MRRLPPALVALTVLAVTSSASATPAFARRYRTSCSTCHGWSFPYLNGWGTRFRDNGYQYPEGAEDSARAAAMIEPGTIAERTAIFSTPPLSIRSRVLADWTENADGERRIGVSVPYLRVAGGGSFFEGVSLTFSADVVPNPLLHSLTVGFHDVLGQGGLSIVAGELFFTGFQRPGHYSVTRLGSPIASVMVGKDPFMLEGTHVGVSLRGRPGWGPLSYELTLANGAAGATGQTGAGAPGLLGRVLVTTGEHTLGLFGYGARARLRLDRGGIDREWDDRIGLAGADAELTFGRFLLYAAGLAAVHDDATGGGGPVRYYGARWEVLWALADSLSVIARFDAVESGDDETVRHRLATLHTGYLVVTSLRVSVEATADLLALETAEGNGEDATPHKNETRILAFVEAAL